MRAALGRRRARRHHHRPPPRQRPQRCIEGRPMKEDKDSVALPPDFQGIATAHRFKPDEEDGSGRDVEHEKGAHEARRNGHDPGAEPAVEGVTVEDFVAYMPAHNYIFTPTREPWPGSSVNARAPSVAYTTKEGEEKQMT